MKKTTMSMNSRTVIGMVCVVPTLSVMVVECAVGAEAVVGPNRFYANGRFGFNISARFTDMAVTLGPGQFENGHVGTDETGNAGGMTWNWGYFDQSQVTGGSVTFNRSSSPADGTSHRIDGDPQYGFEIGYQRVLGRLDFLNALYGLNFSFNYARLDMTGQSTLRGTVSTTRSVYPIVGGAANAPLAPYRGYVNLADFGGAQPVLLGTTPAPGGIQTDPNGAALVRTGLSGDLYGFKLGPFLDIPLSEVFSFQINAGLAVLAADTSFYWNESLSTTVTPAPVRPPASGSEADWMVGGYIGGQLNAYLGSGWSFFLGAEYQNAGDSKMRGGNKEVKLDLSNAFFANAGFSYSF